MKKMSLYYIVAKNTWQEMLSYRLNFFMWRIRIVFQTLTMYFLWASIIPNNVHLFGYNSSLMLTYILGTSLVNSIVISSRTYMIGDDINQGNLSNYLIKPVNYFGYYFSKDIGDKTMNIVFSIGELIMLFFIIRPPLFLQADGVMLIFFIISLILAVIMYFFMNVLMGMIGFWSSEVWAPRFIFIIVLNFFAGGLFPLDILPKEIFSAFVLLPFSYLLYFPLKVYLGQLALSQISIGLLVSAMWIVLLYYLVQVVWKRGLRLYMAYGR